MADQELYFEPLGNHNRAAFSCGVEALDRYFREQAGQDYRKDLAVPFVLYDPETQRVAGFYTLSSNSVVLQSLPLSIGRRIPYEQVPIVLLGRIAVDAHYQGRGLGEVLLVDALTRAYETSKMIGAMAIIVDAKDDTARRFYEKYGFQRMEDNEYRLFLPMKTIATLIQIS
jgi:GNAT superfamily N-acetyltransferase